MATMIATYTEDGRAYLAAALAGTLPVPGVWDQALLEFKCGEGGWEDPGTGPIQRYPAEDDLRYDVAAPPPLSLEQDLDCLVDVYRAPVDQRYPVGANHHYAYTKALTPLDFNILANGTVEVTCTLTKPEANSDGVWNPQFGEIGLYCAHPDGTPGKRLMLVYATFPLETKTAAVELTKVIRIIR